MKIRILTFALITAFLPALCRAQSTLDDIFKKAQQAAQSSNTGSLSNDKITAGLKQALQISTGKAVAATGKPDGFLKNAAIKILLPPKLRTAGNGLRMVGMGSQVDALEVGMNRAAEQAAPAAKQIFINALTWFLRRTVPSSRNAKPACIARTRIAPSVAQRATSPNAAVVATLLAILPGQPNHEGERAARGMAVFGHRLPRDSVLPGHKLFGERRDDRRLRTRRSTWCTDHDRSPARLDDASHFVGGDLWVGDVGQRQDHHRRVGLRLS